MKALRVAWAAGRAACVASSLRLAVAGFRTQPGTVGVADENALAKSVIGLAKTAPIKHSASRRTAEHFERATLEHIDWVWFNYRHLYEVRGDNRPQS